MLPVSIEFDTTDTTGLLRIGGQADVVVYTSDNGIFNLLGKAWIRLVSWMSYVR